MTLTVAGIILQETRSAEGDGANLRVAGRHGYMVYPVAEVQAAHDNVIGLRDQVVPVVFSEKAQLSGFYRVTQAASRLTRFAGGAVQDAVWSLTLERVGTARDVEVESRVPTVGRLTDHAVAPVFWHAPAVGHTSYYTPGGAPSGTVTRAGADGDVTVFRGIPVNVVPRWTVPVADYLAGAVRLTTDGQIRRVGTITPDTDIWQVDNGLIRLTSPGVDGNIGLACWDGNAWRSAKAFSFTAAGSDLTEIPEWTVLRNDPAEVAVRLSYPHVEGRVLVDMSLRRGSRFVTGVIQRHSAATMGIVRATAEAATAQTGGIRATAADADGNRYLLGSARTATANTGTGGLSKSTARFDFFAGYEVGALAAGDAFADLLGQYLGSSGENTRIVRR